MENITILGFVAAALTTISFMPQAVKTIKTKHTKDISLGMYIVLTTGVFLWFIYGIFINDLPILLANGVTLLFIVTILIMKIKYK